MPSESTAAIPTIDHKPHAAFFRQSGWLMIANITGGLLAFGVHFLSKFVRESEYSAFGTLLMVVSCLPTMPLQMVLAQQTALSLATNRERPLASMTRVVWLWTFLLWTVAAIAVLVFRNQITAQWQLPGTGGLLITLPVILVSVWTPIFAGLLQGRQDFFWFGWAVMIGALARPLLSAIFVLVFHLGAMGMMAGALVGVGIGVVICIWRTRDLWSLPRESFDAKALARQVMPLVFGFGACQFLFTADTMFSKAYFSAEQMAPYVATGTLSRALLWLVLPLAAVMFPKLVHSAAKSEKTNLFNIVILGTAILAIIGMLGLWLVGPLVIKLVFKANYLSVATGLLPWYAGAMIPLALSNVMVNDLLARGRFKIVPFMVVLAVGYGLALPYMLSHFPGRIEIAPQTLGVANVLLLLVCAWFTWGPKAKASVPNTPATA